MKLLYCQRCDDVVKLASERRRCRCGACGGRYAPGDDIGVYDGPALLVGASNREVASAVRHAQHNAAPGRQPAIFLGGASEGSPHNWIREERNTARETAATEKLPPPALTPQSVPVRLLLGEAGLPEAVVSGCLERLRMGAEHYGVELATHNGRPAIVDALQEALDAVVYLVQAGAEDAGTPEGWDRVEQALLAALTLCGRRRIP